MTQPFSAPSHHDVLVLLVQLSILLFTARLFGEIAQRFGQPTVLGEILAGIFLGPSFLSSLVPALGEWIVPHTPVQGYLLETVSLLGVLFLLLVTGLETDLALMRRQLRSAIGVALGGLIVPLLMGFAFGYLVPDSLLVDPSKRLLFALFMATALAISAIPVIAKVLIDLNITRRDIGQTIIASAMIDDTTGWILLSVVIGLAGGATLSVAGVLQSVFSVLAFMVISLTLGATIVRRLLRIVQERSQTRDRVLAFVVLLMFVWGAIGHGLGLEALLGAFVIGIVLGQLPTLNAEVIHKIETIALSIFAPIFFAVAGLKVNALSLFTADYFVMTVIVIVVATVAKFAGVYVGARWIGGRDHWTALFFGAGLNARGSMGIIIASIGLSLNLLSQPMFSMIVVMAVFTSVIAPFFLRWTLQHIQPDEQEIERLKREALARESLIENVHRVLLPVRARANGTTVQTVEAKILERLATQNTDLSLTLMTVSNKASYEEDVACLNRIGSVFNRLPLSKKAVVGEAVGDLILNEAKRDYDLMIVGASEGQVSTEVLFTPIVDYLVRLAPCPTVIVRGSHAKDDWQPRRVLILTNGSLAARRAAELGFAVAIQDGAQVHILRVVELDDSTLSVDVSGTLMLRQMKTARQNVEQLAQLGAQSHIEIIPQVLVGQSPEKEILSYAQSHQIDLIVLGTPVQSGTERLFLGARVERILKNAPCPVVILNS